MPKTTKCVVARSKLRVVYGRSQVFSSDLIFSVPFFFLEKAQGKVESLKTELGALGSKHTEVCVHLLFFSILVYLSPFFCFLHGAVCYAMPVFFFFKDG